MYRFSNYLVFVAAVLLLAACNSTETSNETKTATPTAQAPSTNKSHPDGVRRMTVVELQNLVSKGEAFIVDVRSEASYKQGHIKGARLIPTNQVLERADELPRDKVIVTYCS